MCTRPIEKDGNTFACNTCNACIANRKHQWMARAMAEKLEWPHCLCVALTYDPKQSEENRDAREFFVYDDIRKFVHRLTSASRRYARRHKLNLSPRVKFIAAGEQGTKGDLHCHWHMIIYSDLDLTALGTVEGLKDYRKQVLTVREDMITKPGGRKRRLDWSLWGKGFVTFQEPDQGGMAYVLSYCLKDQFTEERSRGTMREAEAENFATGYFAMSKRPAIGETWLVRKMERLESSGSVLPSLNIKIPGMSGFWQPAGAFRKRVLWFLVALNQRAVWATGANAPQWSTLLKSVEDSPSDLEILNGNQEEKERLEEIQRVRTKTIERCAREWEVDSVGEADRLRDWAEREKSRAVLRCLCQSCVEDTYGRTSTQRVGGEYYFFAGDYAAEIAGEETVKKVYGPDAACQCCGAKAALWVVEPRAA